VLRVGLFYIRGEASSLPPPGRLEACPTVILERFPNLVHRLEIDKLPFAPTERRATNWRNVPIEADGLVAGSSFLVGTFVDSFPSTSLK
jgi:hypothetical protein